MTREQAAAIPGITPEQIELVTRPELKVIQIGTRLIINAKWFWSDPQPNPNGVKRMTNNKMTAYVVEGEFVADKNVAIGFAEARAAIRGRPVTILAVEITPDMPRTVFRVVQPEAALIDRDR